MKLQIEAQRLRIRVDEAEFARLLAGEPLQSITSLPGAQLRLQLLAVSVGGPTLRADGGGIAVQLTISDLLGYQQRLPCRDGLEFSQLADDGQSLLVAFEVDVRDSVRNRGPRRREQPA